MTNYSYTEVFRMADAHRTATSPYENLAAAVIIRAADDYRYAARKWHKQREIIRRHYSRYNETRRLEVLADLKAAEDELLSLEKFFNNSGWAFELVQDGDGRPIINKLIKECRTEAINRNRIPKASPYAPWEEPLEFFTSAPEMRHKKLREKEKNK